MHLMKSEHCQITWLARLKVSVPKDILAYMLDNNGVKVDHNGTKLKLHKNLKN